MPKNILQDVISKNEKTIRNVPIPNREGRSHVPRSDRGLKRADTLAEIGPTKPKVKRQDHDKTNVSSGVKHKKSGSKIRSYILYVILSILVIASAFYITDKFSSVTVVLYTKKTSVNVDTEITAKTDDSKTGLIFKTIPFEAEKEASVPTTGEKKSETRSSGTILIYNNYSSTPQRLIINTRFETSSGLIYRLSQSVTVPGLTIKSGKTIPGSIDAKVQADNSGEKYNIGLTDFTVPGFRGTDKFDTFYARSKTPMAGGFVGMVKIVDDAVLVKSKKDLQDALYNDARAQISKMVPPGYIQYPSLLVKSFEDLPDSSPSKDTVLIREKINILSVVLQSDSFASELSKKLAPSFDSSHVEIVDPTNLAVTFNNTFDPSASNISLIVKGRADLVATFDKAKIAGILAGKAKKSFNQALSEIKGLEKAEATIKPLWRLTFPTNQDRIKIVVVLD